MVIKFQALNMQVPSELSPMKCALLNQIKLHIYYLMYFAIYA